MLRQKTISILLALLSFSSFSVFAMEITGQQLSEVIVTKPNNPMMMNSAVSAKKATIEVALMRLRLTPKERNRFFSHNYRQPLNLALESSTGLPSTITLSTNNVPVLDPG